MKITWKKSVISIVVLGFIGIVSANLFTGLSLHPPGEIPGGKYNARFTDHMFKSCPSDEFVKGFDNSFGIICVASNALSYAGPVLSNSHTGSYPSSSPSGEVSNGKLGSFFDKIFGVCPGDKIVKGIAPNGEKICVDMMAPDVFTLPIISTTISSIHWPNVPVGETEKFKSYTANMSNVCGTGMVLSGFQSNGTIICSTALPPNNFTHRCGEDQWCHAPPGYTVRVLCSGQTAVVPESGRICCNVWADHGYGCNAEAISAGEEGTPFGGDMCYGTPKVCAF